MTVTKALKRRLSDELGPTLAAERRAQKLEAQLRRARCLLLKKSGVLVRARVAGGHKLAFSGRLGRRALRPGRYLAEIGAIDAAGNVSTIRVARFQVLGPSSVRAKPKEPRR